jgi:hypothetical protein
LLLPAAGVLALVSLYLPWRTWNGVDDGALANVPGLFVGDGQQHVDGWSTVGDLLALSALLVVTLALVALVRPDDSDRLPRLRHRLRSARRVRRGCDARRRGARPLANGACRREHRLGGRGRSGARGDLRRRNRAALVGRPVTRVVGRARERPRPDQLVDDRRRARRSPPDRTLAPRAFGRPCEVDELVVLPLVLEALVVLDLFRYGFDDATWNTAVLGAIAAAPVALGLVERAGGFERIDLPAVLRVDRL